MSKSTDIRGPGLRKALRERQQLKASRTTAQSIDSKRPNRL